MGHVARTRESNLRKVQNVGGGTGTGSGPRFASRSLIPIFISRHLHCIPLSLSHLAPPCSLSSFPLSLLLNATCITSIKAPKKKERVTCCGWRKNVRHTSFFFLPCSQTSQQPRTRVGDFVILVLLQSTIYFCSATEDESPKERGRQRGAAATALGGALASPISLLEKIY
jgi:hypothetical protein